MRPKKIVGELKTLIDADIAAGKKRGQICKERGVSYQQLQAEYGFLHKKQRKVEAAESVN